MAFGDIGGPCSQLIITCETAEEGIEKGDPVFMYGNGYKVSYRPTMKDQRPIGQALANAQMGQALPVRVRGVSQFKLSQKEIDNCLKLFEIAELSLIWVKKRASGDLYFCSSRTPGAWGTVLKINPETLLVDVLH